MKMRLILAGSLMFALFAAACSSSDDHARRDPSPSASPASEPQQAKSVVAKMQEPQAATDAHGHAHNGQRVPAFQTDAASLKKLPPTLAPEMFTGKQRLAYAVVREIPQTIAQLPCYCYCDEGFGHKSLHSCFVDDHAAHCAVCMDEALAAYNWQKQEGLAPAQIRERVVEQFSRY